MSTADNDESDSKRARPARQQAIEFAAPPYFVTAGIICNSTDNGAPPPVRVVFHTFTVPRLQSLLARLEPLLQSHVRARGGGNQALLLSATLARALVARHLWACYLQSIRTAKKTAAAFIAGLPLPKPLPVDIYALPFTHVHSHGAPEKWPCPKAPFSDPP